MGRGRGRSLLTLPVVLIISVLYVRSVPALRQMPGEAGGAGAVGGTPHPGTPASIAAGSTTPSPSASPSFAALVTPAVADPSAPDTGFAPYVSPPAPAPTRAPDDLLRFVGKVGDALPADYVPPDLEPLSRGASVPEGLRLRHEAALAFEQMCAAARADGEFFYAVSTYRSYRTQIDVYDAEVASYGPQQADRESAEPGRSEHQLGLAVDISIPALGYQLDDSLAQFPEGQWLAAHASDFGFMLSYPDGDEAITGYRFEPWHYRYLGVDAAHAIVASDRTSTEVLQGWLTVDKGPTP